jgi:hypothetical protein
MNGRTNPGQPPYRRNALILPPPFFPDITDPLGLPWCQEGRTIVRSRDGRIVGSIEHPNPLAISAIASWICHSAQLADAFRPLSLEASYQVKPLSHAVLTLKHACTRLDQHLAISAGWQTTAAVQQKTILTGGWWQKTAAFEKLLYTDARPHQELRELLQRDWKHAAGVVNNRLDGTSYLYLGKTDPRQYFFRTSITNVDPNNFVPVYLLGKILRRFRKVAHRLNPTQPEIGSFLAASLCATAGADQELGKALSDISAAATQKKDQEAITLAKQAAEALVVYQKIIKIVRNGTSISAVLALSDQDRERYYNALRNKELGEHRRYGDGSQRELSF